MKNNSVNNKITSRKNTFNQLLKMLMKILTALCIATGFLQANTIALRPHLTEFVEEYIQRQGFRHVHFISHSSANRQATSWNKWLLFHFRRISDLGTPYLASCNSCHGDPETVDSHSLNSTAKSLVCNGKSLSALREASVGSPLFIGIILAMDDFHFLSLVFETEEHRKASWLILTSNKLMVDITKLHLPLDNKVVFAVIDDNNEQLAGKRIYLWDLYKAAVKLEPRKVFLGMWTTKKWSPAKEGTNNNLWQRLLYDPVGRMFKGLEKMLLTDQYKEAPLFSRDPWQRRNDLSGLVIKCTSHQEYPETIFGKRNADGTIDDIQGIYGETFAIIQENLNFTSRCFETTDRTWGSFQDSRWTGMIGDLVENRADIAVSSIDQTPERDLVIDFPYGLQREGKALVIRKVSNTEIGSQSYTDEFTSSTWWLVIASAIIVSCCLCLVFRYSPQQNNETPLRDVAWATVAAFSNTGTTMISTNSVSSRIMLIMLYIMTTLLYAFYNSFLISSLTIDKPYLPFKNLNEMYESKTYTFGIIYGTSMEDYFKYPLLEIHKKIWMEMLSNGSALSPSAENLMTRVLNERHVGMFEVSVVTGDSRFCELVLLPGRYIITQKSMPVAKNSPLFPIFRFQMRKIAETGIFSRLQRKWENTQAPCETEREPITLLQASTAFLLLLIAYSLAVVFLVLEILCAKWNTEQYS